MKRTTNTMSKFEFICESAFWMFVSYWWFRAGLFRCLFGSTYFISKVIFWSLLLTISVFGCYCSLKNHRDKVRVFVNTVTPYGLFTVLAYWKSLPVLIAIAVVFIALGGVSFFIIRMKPKIRVPEKRKQIIKTRFRQAFWGSRVIAATVFLVLVVSLCIVNFTGHSLIPVQEPAVLYQPDSEYTIESQIEVLGNLREDVWEGLSTDERMETLQVVANIEAQNLGLPNELRVVLATDEDKIMAGYQDLTHTIRFNIDYLDSLSAKETLNCICHEAEHAYQHRLIDLYDEVSEEYKNLPMFQAAAEYKNEFLDYKDGLKDEDDYYFQLCEVNARAAADYRVEIYLNKIDYHFNYVQKKLSDASEME